MLTKLVTVYLVNCRNITFTCTCINITKQYCVAFSVKFGRGVTETNCSCHSRLNKRISLKAHNASWKQIHIVWMSNHPKFGKQKLLSEGKSSICCRFDLILADPLHFPSELPIKCNEGTSITEQEIIGYSCLG